MAKQSVDRDVWWFPLWEFAVHVVCGIAIFSFVTLGAIGLHYLVVFAEHNKLDGEVILGLKYLELVVFTLDILIFLVFLVKSTYKGVVTIWQGARAV